MKVLQVSSLRSLWACYNCAGWYRILVQTALLENFGGFLSSKGNQESTSCCMSILPNSFQSKLRTLIDKHTFSTHTWKKGFHSSRFLFSWKFQCFLSHGVFLACVRVFIIPRTKRGIDEFSLILLAIENTIYCLSSGKIFQRKKI